MLQDESYLMENEPSSGNTLDSGDISKDNDNSLDDEIQTNDDIDESNRALVTP